MAGAAPQVFTIEQAATFDAVMLMGCEPKVAFRSEEQERTQDGIPKWEAHVSCIFRQFGKVQYSMLKVGVVAESDPGADIAPGTPVELQGFQIGVMDKQVKNKNTGEWEQGGAQVWYRADGIRSTAATGLSSSRTKSAESAKSAEASA